jgi:hypothetical protein
MEDQIILNLPLVQLLTLESTFVYVKKKKKKYNFFQNYFKNKFFPSIKLKKLNYINLIFFLVCDV